MSTVNWKAIFNTGAYQKAVDGINQKYNQEGGIAISTVEWMVKIDDLTQDGSTISGFDDHVQVFSYSYGAETKSNGIAGSGLPSSSMAGHSLVSITTAIGNHVPSLRTKMNNNENIESIRLVRIGKVLSELKPLHEALFETCRIKKIDNLGDMITITFSISKVTETSYAFNPDGSDKGQTATEIDYTTAEAADA